MDRNKLFEWCITCGFTAEHVNEYERAFEALVETVQYFERVKEREACEAAVTGLQQDENNPEACVQAIRARGQQ